MSRRLTTPNPQPLRRYVIGLWDLAAIATAALGLFMADNGSPWIGAILYGLVVIGIPVALLRNRHLPVALPLTFAARFVIGFVLVLVGVLVVNARPSTGMLLMGTALFYDVCGAIVEGKVRYIPWGAGFLWKTAGRFERPRVYWAVLALFYLLALLFLAIAFGLEAGWFSLMNSRAGGT